jgi:import inner membrane translocase subunit TIM23
MSVRSVLGARTPAMISSLASPSPIRQSLPMASKFTRLHSTAIRPSQCAAPKVVFRHARPFQTSLNRRAARTQSTSASGKEEVKLDWDSFFKLRASRRRYSLASSVGTCLVSTTVGVQLLSSQDLESLGAQVMGLDPFVVLGLATAACGAVGWLAGPVVGEGIWGLVYRRFKPSVVTVSYKYFMLA